MRIVHFLLFLLLLCGQQAYIVLDELLIAGEQQECSAMEVLRIVDNQDEVHKNELLDVASQTVPVPKL